MEKSNEFLEYVLEQLSQLGDIEVKRMFGAFLLKIDGDQLGTLINDILYFKVTDLEIQDRYKKEGSKQFEYTRKGKKDAVKMKNWWSVPESALEDREYLMELAQEVLSQY